MYVEANHVAEKKIILNSPQCIVAILNSSPNTLCSGHEFYCYIIIILSFGNYIVVSACAKFLIVFMLFELPLHFEPINYT